MDEKFDEVAAAFKTYANTPKGDRIFEAAPAAIKVRELLVLLCADDTLSNLAFVVVFNELADKVGDADHWQD